MPEFSDTIRVVASIIRLDTSIPKASDVEISRTT